MWFRALLVAIVAGVVVFALMRSVPTPPAEPTPQPAPTATQRPTQVPLPTLAPQTIISRISRTTPEPPPIPTPRAQPEVAAVDYAFAPMLVTVSVSTTVSFVNLGTIGHDVTGSGPGGDWRSGPLAPSERYTRMFSMVGTYSYVCSIHPEMRGRVVVVQP